MKLTENQIRKYIAGAPNLQTALQQLYNSAPQADEVDFIYAMLHYFHNKKGCKFFKTHQQQVVNEKSNAQCEISDLLIISYSHRWPCMKVNFLQAKLAPFNNNAQGVISVKEDNYFKFHIDGTQYRLLKDLARIHPKNTGLPSNVLSDACSDSITSYGVFYKDGKKIEMAYEITQLLKPNSYSNVHGTSKSKVCVFDTTLDKYGQHFHGGCCDCCHPWRWECRCHGRIIPDLLSTISTQRFEEALFRFQIGSPLCGKLAIDFSNAILTSWSKNVEKTDFESFVTHIKPIWEEQELDNNRANERAGRRDDGNGDFPSSDLDIIKDFPAAPKYILLINVDSEHDGRE